MSRQLPPLFLESLRNLGSVADALPDALVSTAPSVAVRVNTAKGARIPDGADLVPWCPSGFYLADRPLFAADPAWHQGLYYVQEASSMASQAAMTRLVALARDGAPLRVLDACAAPGGKTIGILETLGPDDLVVANEFDPHRANILAENIAKRGAPNVALTRGPAQAFAAMKNSFDIIAADVPCSGEGMMRKDDEAVAQWTPRLVESCAALQREILDALWKALRPGGYLLYSTCTFNRQENELNIEYLIDTYGAECIPLGLDGSDGIIPAIGSDIAACRFLPGRVRGEGLFIAALRKPGTPSAERPDSRSREDAAARRFLDATLARPADYVAVSPDKVSVEAVLRHHEGFIARLRKQLKVVRGGLPVATLKGRDLAPSFELALSTALAPDAYPLLELDYRGAIAYLRGEALDGLPEGTPRSFILPAWQGRPLGLAKSVGRRANNLYPAPFRLRLAADAIPPQAPKVV